MLTIAWECFCKRTVLLIFPLIRSKNLRDSNNEHLILLMIIVIICACRLSGEMRCQLKIPCLHVTNKRLRRFTVQNSWAQRENYSSFTVAMNIACGLPAPTNCYSPSKSSPQASLCQPGTPIREDNHMSTGNTAIIPVRIAISHATTPKNTTPDTRAPCRGCCENCPNRNKAQPWQLHKSIQAIRTDAL